MINDLYFIGEIIRKCITAFLKKINETFTYQVRISDNNYKLTKYVIKNYNLYQEESYKKYRKDRLEEGIQVHKTFPDIYEDMDGVNILITKINGIISSMKENLTQESIYDLNNATNALINENKKYNDIYDSKQLYESSPYFSIMHGFKSEYISKVIKLYTNLYDDILKSEKAKEKVPFDIYETKFKELKQILEKKYTVLYDMSTDNYQKQLYLKNNVIDSQDRERLSRNKLAMADNTSFNIYTLIVLYITLLLLANLIE
jgi:hypothetical protein